MLGRISSRFLASSSSWVRQLSTSGSVLEGELASNSEFASKVAAITNNEPSFPKDFLKDTAVGPSDGPTPSKIKLSFVAPHKILMKDLEARSSHTSSRCPSKRVDVSACSHGRLRDHIRSITGYHLRVVLRGGSHRPVHTRTAASSCRSAL